jgi:hypothetical protein
MPGTERGMAAGSPAGPIARPAEAQHDYTTTDTLPQSRLGGGGKELVGAP